MTKIIPHNQVIWPNECPDEPPHAIFAETTYRSTWPASDCPCCSWAPWKHWFYINGTCGLGEGKVFNFNPAPFVTKDPFLVTKDSLKRSHTVFDSCLGTQPPPPIPEVAHGFSHFVFPLWSMHFSEKWKQGWVHWHSNTM